MKVIETFWMHIDFKASIQNLGSSLLKDFSVCNTKPKLTSLWNAIVEWGEFTEPHCNSGVTVFKGVFVLLLSTFGTWVIEIVELPVKFRM